MSDPWAVLGVSPGASEDDVQAAYRRLAAIHHPDRPGGDARRMAEINAAYSAVRRGQVQPANTAPARGHGGVEAAGSGRPLGCAMAGAIALVVVAATIAIVVLVVSRDGTSDRTAAGSARGDSAVTTSTAPEVKAPSWEDGRLPASASPLAVSVWRRSPAASSCPLLVPAGADAAGTARVVDVANGWGVAWGLANQADAFGVVARASRPSNDAGTVVAQLSWTDGSRALLYQATTRLVADLAIADVSCFYEVYSNIGLDNLTDVLGALQFVDV